MEGVATGVAHGDDEALRRYLFLLFFSFTALFLVFAALLKLLRAGPWCSCLLCRAYISRSWAAEFHNLCDWYAHLLGESPTQTIHIHVLGNTITANPDNVKHMLHTAFHNYPKGKPFSAILGDLLGRGIFNVDGEPWLFQRKMASLELGSLSVRSYAFRIVEAELHGRLLPLLASAADTGTALDLQDVFRRFSFDNICNISFGLDPACLQLSLPVSEFATAFDAATMLSALRATTAWPVVWRLKRLLNWGTERGLRRAVRLVDELAGAVIRQRRQLGFANSNDLLSRFMATVDDDRYLRDIVISFLLAGRDTVASALAGLVLLLSRHPHARDEMLEEIARVMGEEGGDVASAEQLSGMHYVHAALYESMRLYPPVQFDSKFCLEDDVLPDGTFVARGTRVTYHPYAMGRMEGLWGSDCADFRPERWLRDGVFTPECPFKYTVFQAGQRVCAGKEMAVMEMKATIVSVVRAFDVEVLLESPNPKFAPGLTATFAGGLPARVRRR